jgi:hypothetical protein
VRGSVRKPRTDGGTWSYRLDLGFDDVGKRRQREIGGFATKKEAQAALNDALSDVQRGTFVAPSRTTVREFLELWIDGVKTEVALTAWLSYRQAVRRHINPHLGSKRLGELSALDVKRWHGVLLTSGRQDGGRSPRTRSNSRTEYFIARSPTRFAGIWSSSTRCHRFACPRARRRRR